MPSNRAFLDPDIVQPTKYVVPPTCVAKELPLELWQLPKFKPFIIDGYNAHSEPICQSDVDHKKMRNILSYCKRLQSLIIYTR